MRKMLILASCLALLPLAALAQEKPTPAEAKKFLDFYLNGQGKGVVLVEMKVCEGIGEEAENLNECEGAVDLNSLEKGNAYYVWTVFLVPNGDKVDGIEIQFHQGGETKLSKEASVIGSIRYRNWRRFVPRLAGSGEIKVVRGEETLGTLKVNVSE